MTGERLEVRLFSARVGAIAEARDGGFRFVPDRAWVAGGQYPPLGLDFLVDPRPPLSRDGRLPAWFENLLPERGSALRRWLAKQHGIAEHDSVALLAAVGRDLPGAVEVLPLPSLEPSVPLAPAAEPPPGELRFSLAGMQLKLSMVESGDRLALPARGSTGRWIVKIPSLAFPDLPDVEAATMRWARAVGIPTPEFEVVPIARLLATLPEPAPRSGNAFAIARFDRTSQGRIHQEDLAQALRLFPEQKYGPEAKIRYDGLARLVRDAAGEPEAIKLIERVAFVLASGNDDAHLKNWSLQWGTADHRPWLSPAYDQVATLTWWSPETSWQDQTLALALGGPRRFAEVDRRAVETFASRAGVDDGTERFFATLERAARTLREVGAPKRMQEALGRLWRLCPVLRELTLTQS